MRATAVLILVLCLQSQAAWPSKVRLSADYRLQDLLFDAHNDDFFTVKNIQDMNNTLASFSEVLAFAAEAAGRRMSLETARLLLPANANVTAFRAAGFTVVPQTWELKTNADIRLTDSGFDNITVMPADECYTEKRYIEMGRHLITRKGEPRSLVAAFAQYRWGVLSERGPANKRFYFDNSKWYPNICSLAVPGTYSGANGVSGTDISVCLYEDAGGVIKLHSSCAFFPSYAGDLASLLYSSMRLFCNQSSHTPASHNPRADNDHNNLCGCKSAVEVMLAHKDFSSTTAGVPTSDTVPTLLLVQPGGVRKVALVLDVSGSMGGSRIENLVRAATLYLKYFLETGAELAIVTFSDVVEVIQPMTKVSDQAVREQLATNIKGLGASGYTNIADAITVAMGLLGASAPYSKSQTGFIVLISDGEHNVGPSLNDSIRTVAETSIVVDTLCISNSADSRLAKLANDTGGMKLFSSETTTASTELETGFAKLADRSPGSSSGKFKLLRATTIALPGAGESVQVDSSITSSLHFMMSMSGVDLSTINFTVVNPNGTVYGSFSGPSVYEVVTSIGTITIKIPDAEIEPGTWELYISSASPTGRRKRSAFFSSNETQHLSRVKRSTGTGTVVVVGQTGGNSSISIDAWLRHSSFSKVTESSVQRIYAYCKVGSAPLTNATLEAVVTPGTGGSFIIPLRDDGVGTDLTANDAVYVGQILPEKMTSVGDYSVTVVMTSPANRVATAGAFRVDALATGPVTLPPGKVTGVTVAMSVKYQFVRVGFIAPGNQEFEGIAAGYEIRASNSFDQVSQSLFYTAPLIAKLTNGQPVGTNIQVTLWATNFTGVDTNSTFYVAVAALSTADIRGESSSPVGASLSYPTDYTPPSTTTTIEPTTNTPTTNTPTTNTPTTNTPTTNTPTTNTPTTNTPTTNMPTTNKPTTNKPTTNTPTTNKPITRDPPATLSSPEPTDRTSEPPEPDTQWSPAMIATVGVGTAVILAEIVGIVAVVKLL